MFWCIDLKVFPGAFLVAQIAAPMTNVGCVPPSDEIGTTGSAGLMDDSPEHTLCGNLCSEMLAGVILSSVL